MENINRRQFLKWGAIAGTGAFFFPSMVTKALAKSAFQQNEDPHFFLMITMPLSSGLDNSYLFDARPLEMTKNGIIQNYRKSGDPTPWLGSNGISTLATDIVKPLLPFKSDFSIVNGALMDIGFDGHDQNINFLFTGDPFGGESFVPTLNQGNQSPKELDAILRGRYSVTQKNGSQTVPLSPSGAKNLISALQRIPPLAPQSDLFQFLMSRFDANSSGPGGFSSASGMMKNAFSNSSHLAAMMTQINADATDSNESFIKLLGQVFRTGAAKSGILVLDQFGFDTHDSISAAKQPVMFGILMDTLASIFASMKSTPYDSTRSLLDVTTVMFCSEFSRTLRQNGRPIDDTGTDHNPLNNSILIGGKGIRCGQVIGSSDYASSTETLSSAHLLFDKGKFKTMGRPFDFDRGISRTDLPTEYKASDYLGIGSVVNTIQSAFGVPQSRWRLSERNGAIAPVIKQLLS